MAILGGPSWPHIEDIFLISFMPNFFPKWGNFDLKEKMIFFGI